MRTQPVMRWRGLVLTAAAAAMVLTGAACGDDGDDDAAGSTSTTAEVSEFCGAIEELGDSLAALSDVDITNTTGDGCARR